MARRNRLALPATATDDECCEAKEPHADAAARDPTAWLRDPWAVAHSRRAAAAAVKAGTQQCAHEFVICLCLSVYSWKPMSRVLVAKAGSSKISEPLVVKTGRRCSAFR